MKALAASLALVGALLAVLVYFDVHLKLIELLQWVEQQGSMAAVLFIVLMALTVMFLLPGIFFTTGAGYVFGIPAGTLYVVLGTTLGASIAFLVARHLFGARAKDYVLGKSKLHLLNTEMAKHDFKIVLLTRLIPFFPGKLSNYFFGLTDFRFASFTGASLLGFIPFSLHNVYIGSLISDLAELREGGLTRSPMQWALYGFGFIVTIVALWYFNRIAKRALSGYTADTEQASGKGDVASAQHASRERDASREQRARHKPGGA
ncbi:MAG: TVP38/TMEM64 family protein [Burkholderiales bacterium]